jgi:hypothetical protein
MFMRTRLLLQVPAVMLILAFVPTNPGKLAALLLLWALTFGRLSKVETIFYICVCLFFTVMNTASLKQGIFMFAHPDLLLQPVWELFMWGFYLVHTRRLLNGPAPEGRRATIWALALAYSAAFATIHDSNTLLLVTGALLLVGLALFHAAGPGLCRLYGAAGCADRIHGRAQRPVGISRQSAGRGAAVVHHDVGRDRPVHAPLDRADPGPP